MAKVNKVGQKESATQTKEEKGRIDFPVAEAMYVDKEGKIVTAVNNEGLLIAVPKPIKDDNGNVTYSGYNVRRHLPIKKGQFESTGTYLRYQAYVARLKAAILIKNAEDKESKAERVEKFGDEKTRRAVAKVAKMREMLKSLESQLEAEGVNVEDI
jgi:hypothetical protein